MASHNDHNLSSFDLLAREIAGKYSAFCSRF
jgi:hypothetical protein